jgi:chemotaxis protein histidine kinase CheA
MARAKKAKAKAKRKAVAKPAKKNAAAKKATPKKKVGKAKKTAAKSAPMPRAAKGKRPQYFEDPAVDKLHLMVMALIEELSVTRDRLDTVERLIEKHGLFQVQEIEDFFPDLQADAERTGRRIAYIRRVMKGITDELENLHGEDPALEFDEVVDVISS